ncbi:MAG: carbohydrate ABC transporter permease [Actinoallomurus sp.]
MTTGSVPAGRRTVADPFGSVRRGSLRTLRAAFLLAVAVFFALPVLWLLLAATRTSTQIINGSPLAFGSFGNVATAWGHLQTYNDGEIITWIANSLAYTLSSVVIALALCVPAGYALAKYDFRGRQSILVITLIGMIIPTAALVLPLYLEMTQVGLLDTAAAVILPFGFYPFGVYLAYIYYAATLPDSLLEAARIDGCGELRLFLRIGLPLARPVVALIAFFCFVRVWTDFFLPFVMLTDEHKYTLQLGLKSLLESTGAINGLSGFNSLPIHQPEAALAALVAIGPILVAFLFAQRHLVAGHLAGAEKS